MQTGVECGMYPHHSVTFADTPQPNTEFIACERGQNIFVAHLPLNDFFIYVVCKEKRSISLSDLVDTLERNTAFLAKTFQGGTKTLSI